MTARILSRRNKSVGSQQPTQPGHRRWPARAPPANRLAGLLQPEDPLVYGGEVLHAV